MKNKNKTVWKDDTSGPLIAGIIVIFVFLSPILLPRLFSYKSATSGLVIALICIVLAAGVIALHKLSKKNETGWKWPLGKTVTVGLAIGIFLILLFLFQPWRSVRGKEKSGLAERERMVTKYGTNTVHRSVQPSRVEYIDPVYENFSPGWNDLKKGVSYYYIRGKNVGMEFTPKDFSVTMRFTRVGNENVGLKRQWDGAGNSYHYDVVDDAIACVEWKFTVDKDVRMYIQHADNN